jgi:hypothetical protein
VHERWRYGVTKKESGKVQRRINGGIQTIDINQLGIDKQSRYNCILTNPPKSPRSCLSELICTRHIHTANKSTAVSSSTNMNPREDLLEYNGLWLEPLIQAMLARLSPISTLLHATAGAPVSGKSTSYVWRLTKACL